MLTVEWPRTVAPAHQPAHLVRGRPQLVLDEAMASGGSRSAHHEQVGRTVDPRVDGSSTASRTAVLKTPPLTADATQVTAVDLAAVLRALEDRLYGELVRSGRPARTVASHQRLQTIKASMN